MSLRLFFFKETLRSSSISAAELFKLFPCSSNWKQARSCYLKLVSEMLNILSIFFTELKKSSISKCVLKIHQIMIFTVKVDILQAQNWHFHLFSSPRICSVTLHYIHFLLLFNLFFLLFIVFHYLQSLCLNKATFLNIEFFFSLQRRIHCNLIQDKFTFCY